MLSVSRCHKCDKKADAKDGDILLCTEHWLEIYGGLNGKSQSMVDGHGGRRDVHDTWCEKHGESLIEVYNEARQKFAEHVEVEDE